MKIFVAFDGSKCSERALDDLIKAGLPEACEATVISVAEVWLPPPNGNDDPSEIKLDPAFERMIERQYEARKKIVAESATFANHAKRRLQAMFPTWKVNAESTYGSPAWEILDGAREFKANLIVVGSHGGSSIGRFLLGSISQKVLTEAHCSVRVARGRVEVDPSPSRLIIGFDGSKGSQAAVEAVAERSWRENSEVRLIVATDRMSPATIGRFLPPVTHVVEEVNRSEREWIEKRASAVLIKLQSSNISASLHFIAGNPKTVLVEQAEGWHADSIFVGANSFGSRFERFLLGSTSAAVASRAHCSVEVVRT